MAMSTHLKVVLAFNSPKKKKKTLKHILSQQRCGHSGRARQGPLANLRTARDFILRLYMKIQHLSYCDVNTTRYWFNTPVNGLCSPLAAYSGGCYDGRVHFVNFCSILMQS